MTDNLTIRRVTADDASTTRALRLEMLADTPLAFVTTLDQAAAMPHAEWVARAERSSTGPTVALFVAEGGDGRLVGQVFAAATDDKPDVTSLYAVYVTPAHRGGRVLADLVGAAATWSVENNRNRLELEVVTTNERAARAYRKLGFVDVGEAIAHPTIAELREQLMARAC